MTQRISIEASFQWAQRIALREWPLMLPVALAFLVLPPFAAGLLLPPEMLRVFATPPIQDMAAAEAALAWLLPLALAVFACGSAGALALLALALRPRISVAEALLVGARRVAVLIGALLLLFAGLVLGVTVLAFVVQLGGVPPLRLQGLLIAAMFLAIIFLTVRLAMLGPVVVERKVGPIEAIAASWRLGRGQFWRVLAVLAIYLAGGIVVLLALNTALRAVVLLVARAAGAPEVGLALAGLCAQLGSAVLKVGAYLLIAGLYRQLVEPSRGI